MNSNSEDTDRVAAPSRFFFFADALRRCRAFVLIVTSLCVALAILPIYFPVKSQSQASFLMLLLVAVAFGYLGFIVWEATYARPGANRVFASLPIASQNIHLNHWLIKFLAPAISAVVTLALAFGVSALRARPLDLSTCALALFISIALMGMNLATHSVGTKSALGKLAGIGPFALLILIIFRPAIGSTYASIADTVLILAGCAYTLFGIVYLKVSKALAQYEVFNSTWIRANNIPASSRARSVARVPYRPPSRLWRGATGLVWCRFRVPLMCVTLFALTAVFVSILVKSIFKVELKFDALFPMTLVLMPLAWLLNLDWIEKVLVLKTLPLSRTSLAMLLMLTGLAPAIAIWTAQLAVLSLCTTEPHVEFAYALPMWVIQLFTTPVVLRYRSSLIAGWGLVLTLTFIMLQIASQLLAIWHVRGRLPSFAEPALLAALACAALWWTTHELSQTNRPVMRARARENRPT